MGNYKDFTDFNEAAEDLRPTARIQLVQRILNAASVISNVAQGVPLKWANAYKSFQVLVPNSNSAPTDYTTDEAISAVDSILFEADAQLTASNEDMNTLRSELENLQVYGYMQTSVDPASLFYKYVVLTNSQGLYYCIEFSDPTIMPRVCVMNEATLNSQSLIRNNEFVFRETSNFPAPHFSYPMVLQTSMIAYTWNNTNYVFTIKYMLYSGRHKVVITRYKQYLGQTSNPPTIEFADYDFDAYGSDPGTGTIVYMSNEYIYTNNSVSGEWQASTKTIDSLVEITDVLGLPDPTEVINILENLESNSN